MSNLQTGTILLTGETLLDQQFEGSDLATMFLSGTQLREFLVGLADDGLI